MFVRPSYQVCKQMNDIVDEYLDKWPNLGNRTVARMIYNNNKEKFIDIESVRRMIRYRKGTNGQSAKAILLNNKNLYAKPRI